MYLSKGTQLTGFRNNQQAWPNQNIAVLEQSK
jgi:hypothetical protein